MANDLLVMDIVDQGTPGDTYPISITVSGPQGQAWSWLVYPLEEWNGWDIESADEHCVPRSLLLDQGRDGFIICREMNAVFSGERLVAPLEATKLLLARLFADIGVGCAFSVTILSEMGENNLGKKITDEIDQILEKQRYFDKSRLIFDLISPHITL
jgi:hypothetical protein